MEKLNFSDCTLARVEDTFNLMAVESLATLTTWINTDFELTDLDKIAVNRLCFHLQKNVLHWNEQDLSLHFIGPMFSYIDFTERYRFNLFAQRTISAEIQGIALGGRTDEIIASGFRDPKTPFFAINEYKRETDPDGDPAGQVLAAMLVGQELNLQKEVKLPLYGCYIRGRNWFFMILEGNKYAMTNRGPLQSCVVAPEDRVV